LYLDSGIDWIDGGFESDLDWSVDIPGHTRFDDYDHDSRIEQIRGLNFMPW
jgi:hypothetical protein